MSDFQYRGVRPHAESLVQGTPAVIAKVEGNKSLTRLNSLLGQVALSLNKNDPATARKTLDAAKVHLDELSVAHRAGQAAFDEVSAAFPPPEPTAEDQAESDEGAENDEDAELSDPPKRRGKR